MKINMCHYFGGSRRSPKLGERGATRAQAPPGTPLGCAGRPPWALVPPSVPPSGLYLSRYEKILKEYNLQSSATTSWRKPTEKKSHLRWADSAGENTSRKGRSSPLSSSSSSRAYRDHHQHHPHHQHHLHLHPISSHHCNLCCNSHYSSPLLYGC